MVATLLTLKVLTKCLFSFNHNQGFLQFCYSLTIFFHTIKIINFVSQKGLITGYTAGIYSKEQNSLQHKNKPKGSYRIGLILTTWQQRGRSIWKKLKYL